jgi:hypothetical protein
MLHFLRAQFQVSVLAGCLSPDELQQGETSWQKVVLAEMRTEHRIVCPICLEDALLAPLLTPCGHIFCGHCIYLHCCTSVKKEFCPTCNDPLFNNNLRPVRITRLKGVEVGQCITLDLKLRHPDTSRVFNYFTF